jgi:hypothetical protein
MGRGLSDLQRWILQQASERTRLYVPEICQGFFGWQPKTPLHRYGESDHPTRQPSKEWGERDGDMIPFGGQYFSRKEIGAREYRRVMVTISRALSRLQGRGLVEGSWWERPTIGIHFFAPNVSLTEQGRTWLSVNTHDINKNVSQ